MPSQTCFAVEALGGATALRAIITTFVHNVYGDIMIGYMFAKVDRHRLIELEYQHAAAFLGASVTYRGRPLDRAHARHRIAGGQFARRRRILAEALQTHAVPGPIAERWLAHQDALRHLITADPEGLCHGGARR